MLIIVILGAYLYQFYYRTIYEDFKEANSNYLLAFHNRHENDMEIMNNIVVQIGLAYQSAEFILKESPMKSLELEEQLYRYTSVSQFFNQIFFFYHGDQYLYNHNTSVTLERFLKEGILLEQTDQGKLREILYRDKRGMSVLPEQKVEGYLSKKSMDIMGKAIVYTKALEPKNISTVTFVVGSDYYDALLNSEVGDKRQNYIFYNGEQIVSRGLLDLDEEIILSKIIQSDTTSSILKVKGKKYLMTLEVGESGLTYCTLQSMSVFQNKLVAGQWGILILLAICSVPTSIAIILLFRSLSRKVRNINVLLSADEKGYYNLENIEVGIRTLVENNKEVTKESLKLRQTKFISRFIRNEYSDRDTVVWSGERVGLYINYRFFMVILMGGRENSNESKAHDLMLLELTRRQNEAGYGIHLMNHNQSLFVIFGEDDKSLKSICQEFLAIGNTYCEEFVIAASECHQDFMEASKAYLEASTAFDNRFLVDNSRIIYFTDVAHREQVKLIPATYINKLKLAIRQNDKIQIQGVIREICDCLQNTQQSLLTFRIFYNDIIHLMISEWQSTQSNFENIYSVFTLSQCLTIHDFNEILCEVCDKLLENRGETETGQPARVKKAIDYMKINYKNPELNMAALAEYLDISSVTLAVEFKNVIGISPSDYLATIRMENAKVLLKETKLRVREVSLAVGYEDDHVFMRRFKKYVGKTPGQFRVEQ